MRWVVGSQPQIFSTAVTNNVGSLSLSPVPGEYTDVVTVALPDEVFLGGDWSSGCFLQLSILVQNRRKSYIMMVAGCASFAIAMKE
ncbi:hypothetical protein AX16_002734 [Volvariella volvacea WC 439]|nr:hypothetical protein AX16_002734 [Volvariella volvacea WC 439]